LNGYEQLTIKEAFDLVFRYGNTGCRRTYLSGRDLQAHIQHRHHKNTKEDDK
jgi:hypothetical protein